MRTTVTTRDEITAREIIDGTRPTMDPSGPRWPKPTTADTTAEALFGCSEEELRAADPELFGDD